MGKLPGLSRNHGLRGGLAEGPAFDQLVAAVCGIVRNNATLKFSSTSWLQQAQFLKQHSVFSTSGPFNAIKNTCYQDPKLQYI